MSLPARAVLAISATATTKGLTRAIDQGLAGRLFAPRELEDVLARNRPCRGAARLAAILGDPTATELSRSKREKRLLRLIRDAGLPMPETNVPFGGFELREKELAVRAAGLEMRRFTNDHVLNDVVAAIAGALAIRRGRG